MSTSGEKWIDGLQYSSLFLPPPQDEQQRQVVDALCDVVSASPTEALTAIVLQAERDLQPWIARDDDQGQRLWRINQRIVKLNVELMRNHDSPEALIILASASDLLLRATDGMLVDGEACTLPQLELLEITARAIRLVINWEESGYLVADGLSNLLKCRLSAIIRYLSHPSAHVHALSISVLQDLIYSGPIKSSNFRHQDRKGICNRPYQCLHTGIIDWHAVIENCIRWEAHSRRATGQTSFSRCCSQGIRMSPHLLRFPHCSVPPFPCILGSSRSNDIRIQTAEAFDGLGRILSLCLVNLQTDTAVSTS